MVRGVLLVGLVGCVTSSSAVCSDGTLCPEDTSCALVMVGTTPTDFCVSPAQIASCTGHPDGDACQINTTPGTCHDQVCLPTECGNGLLDQGEVCDDGNQVSGDYCSADCKSTEACGNKIVDSVHGEQCDFGDTIQHDGCSSDCQLEFPQWQSLKGVLAPVFESLVYDALRHRLVMFSGNDLTSPGGLFGAAIFDTVEWDGRRWYTPATPVAPTPRDGGAIVYDDDDHQVVLFGGGFGDTWTYDAHGWTVQQVTASPSARTNSSIAYDARSKSVILFGGNEIASGLDQNDTWVWQHGTWTELAIPMASRPPIRSFAGMAYDSKRDVIVLVGGGVVTAQNDVWEFDGTTWTQKTPATNVVPPTGDFSAAFDPVQQRVLAVSSFSSAGYEWDGNEWTAIATAPIEISQVTTDVSRGRIELVGFDTGTDHGQLYEFDGTSWTLLSTIKRQAPTPRFSFALATDPRRREIVLFGGNDGSVESDTWVWNGSWVPQAPAIKPSPRTETPFVYDPIHDELVLFGGCDGGTKLADTWVWRHTVLTDSGQWVQRTTTTQPTPRCDHQMAWDGVNNKVLLFGGEPASNNDLNDTWSWDGTKWTQLTPATSPPVTASEAMAYDPIRQRVVLLDKTGTTWTWDGTNWTQINLGFHPAAYADSHFAWDAARRRLVLSVNGTNDIWEWDGTQWYLVPVGGTPAGRRDQGFVPEPEGAGVVLLYGSTDNLPITPLADFARLRWDTVGVVEETCTTADIDGDKLAGCADPDCWATCTPYCPPETTGCAATPSCGDGTCDPILETCDSCAVDCGACAASCGNYVCDPGETTTTCPGDCT